MINKIFLFFIPILFFSCASKIHEIAYYKNGNKKYDIQYKNGKIDGIAKYWDDSGNLINEVNYINDQFHEQWIDYFTNGKISHIINYEYGRKHGKEIWYYKSGQKKSEAIYKNDNIDSDIIRWDENGNIIYKWK